MFASPRFFASFTVLALVAAGLSTAAAQDMRRPKKLIATGWDHADSQRLLENLEAMEKRPFDGVVIQLTGKTDQDKPCALGWAFGRDPWKREWFRPCVDQLRACKFRRFTDNFVQLNANPGDVDWFDDQGWQSIVEHCRTAAWVAKESGVKGILFDPEPYAPPHAQFAYAAQPQRDQHSFDAYCQQARRRGREVMQAIAEEDPNITFFCYFMESVCATAAGQADPRPALATQGYGLYPAFIDGWLDAAPPTVTFVDGCESAYRYNSTAEYLESAVAIKGACQELVSPENRAKYRAQVQVSFGIYLDAYWNPKESPWYIDGLGCSRVDRLRANVGTALRVADEYVWVYGERFRWWPTPNQGVRPESWPEALPGCDKALGFVRDPVGYARMEIDAQRQAGTLVNLVENGDFAADSVKWPDGRQEAWTEGGPPAGWHTWQEAASKGTFTRDREAGATGKGSARAANVGGGCFIQAHDVQPGERYAVRAMRKLQGRGGALIRVRWQTAAGAWIAEDKDQVLPAVGPRDQWQEIFGVVEVPEGAGRLLILLGVGQQTSAEDIAWFDDAALYRIP